LTGTRITGVEQGDQIRRIFAHRATHYFGHFSANYRNSANNQATFFRGKSYALIFLNNVLGYTLGGMYTLGYTLGGFFTNASRHPAGVSLSFLSA
jgi:hypothetical protein